MIELNLFFILPFFIALFAYEGKALTISGGITGILMAYLIMFTQNEYWFMAMFAFFVFASIATRHQEKKKEKYEAIRKIRGPNHILANGGVSIIAALAGNPYLFLGSLATSLADTMSSEVGMLSKSKPIMITTFKRTKTGKNGGVTFLGNSVALASSVMMGLFGLLIIPDVKIVVIVAIAGFCGMLIDSLIGAIFENKGHIGNDGTNFVASALGGTIAVALSLFI